MEDLLSTFHQMSHLQYYLQYKEQPFLFREEALPGKQTQDLILKEKGIIFFIKFCIHAGFHEAVSDAIGLSALGPQHMHRIGLYNSSVEDYEGSINFLMLVALQKVAYLPFAYIVDQVRIPSC